MMRLMLALTVLSSSLIAGEIHLITATHEHVVVDVLSREQMGCVKALAAPALHMDNERVLMIHKGKVLSDCESVQEYMGEEVFIAERASRYSVTKRDYWAPLSHHEQETIHYVLTTLANKPLLSLPSHRSSLEEAGKRIEHIHPLKFLQHAYSDEELKVCMGVIQGRCLVWKEFITNFSASFQSEVKKGNLTSDHLHHFADTVAIKIDLIMPHAEKSDWVKFVKVLNTHVPRSGNQKRYNI